MSYTINDFQSLVPMRYYNNEDKSNKKRQAMVDNFNNDYIASCKKDGDWSMLIHYSKGHNLIRSRSISKVTGVYGDYTAKLPHICEAMDEWPDNTVLLAELCWDEPGTNANTVGTILRCLPAKAVERQKEKKLKAVCFDCLMIEGEDITEHGYYERISRMSGFLAIYLNKYVYPTQFFFEEFAANADRIISNGGEGLVIQLKTNPYMPGTRTAWKTLKLKQSLPEMELKVVGTIEPKKFYEGDCPETWEYKLVDIDTGVEQLVTKPYYYGWMNGITVELPDGTTTDVASGLTDDDRAWLSTQDAQDMIRAGDLYAVVKAMSFNDKGRLRHPYLVRLRNDMQENYMRNYDVAIIGSGPGGLTAALYLLRAGRRVVMFEKEGLGGQLGKCPLIENYPGFTGPGGLLVDHIFDQLNIYDAFDFEPLEVISLTKEGNGWILLDECEDEYKASYIIYAAGASPIGLNVPGASLSNVHYCATCDGPLYKGQNVVVIGDGNSALQYALELSNYCLGVCIVTLFDSFFGEKELINRVENKDNIVVFHNFKTVKITDKTVESEKGLLIRTQGVFVAIGQKPNTGFAAEQAYVSLDERNYIITDDTMRAQDRFYAVGDCRRKDVRQVITAMNDGCIAAVNINKLMLKGE